MVWIEPLHHAAQTGLKRSFVPDHLVVADRHAAAIYRESDTGAQVHPEEALDALPGAARCGGRDRGAGAGACVNPGLGVT